MQFWYECDIVEPLPPRSFLDKTPVPAGLISSLILQWSFGVTMWEIFNKGQLPYPKFIDGIRLEEHIKKGCHPENTPHCPVEM